jgi:hypothetical protein
MLISGIFINTKGIWGTPGLENLEKIFYLFEIHLPHLYKISFYLYEIPGWFQGFEIVSKRYTHCIKNEHVREFRISYLTEKQAFKQWHMFV